MGSNRDRVADGTRAEKLRAAIKAASAQEGDGARADTVGSSRTRRRRGLKGGGRNQGSRVGQAERRTI